jgi:hypothetical protein
VGYWHADLVGCCFGWYGDHAAYSKVLIFIFCWSAALGFVDDWGCWEFFIAV